MGLDQTVVFSDAVPTYQQVAELLSARGLSVQLRMIDGELAFPDETPLESWQELRVSLGGGMITMRRADRKIVLAIWGNADRQLVQAWNVLTWAWAVVAGGEVEMPSGRMSAEEFVQIADLPASVTSTSG